MCVQELSARTTADAAVSSLVTGLTAEAVSHQSILVSWSPPGESSGVITEYRSVSRSGVCGPTPHVRLTFIHV